MSHITPDLLRTLLRYDPDTGRLFWLERSADIDPRRPFRIRFNDHTSGNEAFTSDDGNGYRQGKVLGKKMRGHRVAWAIFYGKWPEGDLRHRNGVRSDNRIANLRDERTLRQPARRNSSQPVFEEVA